MSADVGQVFDGTGGANRIYSEAYLSLDFLVSSSPLRILRIRHKTSQKRGECFLEVEEPQ